MGDGWSAKCWLWYLHTNCSFQQTNCTYLHTNCTYLHTNLTYLHTNCNYLLTNCTYLYTNCTYLHTSCTYLPDEKVLSIICHWLLRWGWIRCWCEWHPRIRRHLWRPCYAGQRPQTTDQRDPKLQISKKLIRSVLTQGSLIAMPSKLLHYGYFFVVAG